MVPQFAVGALGAAKLHRFLPGPRPEPLLWLKDISSVQDQCGGNLCVGGGGVALWSCKLALLGLCLRVKGAKK